MNELTNKLLTDKFGGEKGVAAEIINLEAILRLPKGTEHFLSDLHGEYEAFCHLMNNCSGVVREKIGQLFGGLLTPDEQRELATTVYYPAEKISALKSCCADMNGWYKTTLYRLTELARETGRKYTRSKVRKSMPQYFGYILDEMIYGATDIGDKAAYYNEIFSEIIKLEIAAEIVCDTAALIKRLAIDHLHIVGDVYDRGEAPDKIMDMLTAHHSIDISWGNHDILWMGAAAGSAVCAATVIEMCLKYGNLELLEIGYGISLRELSLFSDSLKYDSKFAPRETKARLSESDIVSSAKMRKALFKIILKLEGQSIERNPDYNMDNRNILRLIDCTCGTVNLDGEIVPLIDPEDFCGIDGAMPNKLTADESRVIEFIVRSFTGSEKLKRHFNFLMEKGAFYTVYNCNLIFHGCIPLNGDGTFKSVKAAGNEASGKALLDRFDHIVRSAAISRNENDKDIFWYLWCGKDSPLFGRNKLASFESIYVADKAYGTEDKNAYYTLSRERAVAENILEQFGLSGERCHIINGHIPVEMVKGENPIKAKGKLLVIDGGFCRAYHSKTGIAGYTLIYSSHGMRLAAHRPFTGKENALKNNDDIVSDINIFEAAADRIKVSDTDNGTRIREQISTLKELLRGIRGRYKI